MNTLQKSRLLIVVNVFNPDRGGGGAIFSDLCYGLAEHGYAITVRCAYPYYPEWKDKTGKNGLKIERYDEKGVHIERYGIFIPSDPRSLIQRLVYEASFFFSLIRSIAQGGQFDLVMTYCPLVGAVAFSALNKMLYRKPLWLNVQDLSADAASASGIAKGRLIPQVLQTIQSLLFNRADVWSTISPVMVKRLEAIRKRGQEIHYLPNWLNKSMADEIAELPQKAMESLNDPIRLLYAGNIGGKQDLLRFCQVLAKSDAAFMFHIQGSGAESASLEAWIRSKSDSRFMFGRFLDEPDFAAALQGSDLFVITEKTGSGGSFIPCKMIAGISSGIPILAVCDAESPLGSEVQSHQLGPWFGWESVNEVGEFLSKLPKQIDLITRWRKDVRIRARFYTRDRLIDQFAVIIDNLTRHQC
jgi:colanic acid biosynthesis glycosyl transferase WcaI